MRPVVLTFLGYYLPGYKSGGPVRTLANIVEQLGDEFSFRIITRDRDALDPFPYPNISINEWNAVGKAHVLYASSERLSFKSLVSLINILPYDMLYLNSFFDWRFSIQIVLARRLGLISDVPLLLAPRGEFSQGALAIKKAKKRTYIAVAKLFGLYRNTFWQASSEDEASDVKRVMSETADNIHIAPNLTSSIAKEKTEERESEADTHISLLFLSRISPKKNLDFALEALRTVRVPVKLTVCGTIEDEGYWKKCKRIIQSLPDHLRVEYEGEVEHSEVSSVMRAHDMLFFPTRGENFGHVIFESLAAGTPVLISDQTPWRDVEKFGAGWIRPLEDMQGFSEVISEFAALPRSVRLHQRASAKQYAVQWTKNNEPAEANRIMFRKVLKKIRPL